MPQKSFALITAAGNSSRMGGNKKELIELKNKPLLIYTITPFLRDKFSRKSHQ